jgi:hypothetical protein
MLRFFVLILLLLNLGYYAWTHELLRAWGLGPLAQTEPQRLALQIRPEDVRIVGRKEAQRMEAPQPEARASQCVVAGPFDEKQATAWREALAGALTPDVWALEAVLQPARWIIYMGRYESADALAKKKAELKTINVSSESLRSPSLAPGLSLGGFDTQADASAALIALAQRGVRTARVLQEHAEVRGELLRLAQADERLLAQVDALKVDGLAVGLSARVWRPCLVPPAPAGVSPRTAP